jgi:hypothetical protein
MDDGSENLDAGILEETKNLNTENREMMEYMENRIQQQYEAEQEMKSCPACDGSGILVDVGIEPQCCGRFDKYGGCCGQPNAVQVPEPVQCQYCEATGQIPVSP